MIYGIGRNYAKHAQELGNSVPQSAPIVFFKPDAGIVKSSQTVTLPKFSNEVHYEGEVAFRFGKNLEISEITIANDLTARDKQKEAQESKSPWALAKGFKQSTGLGNWIPASKTDLGTLAVQVLLNDRQVQLGFTKDMIFNFEFLQKYLTETFPVQPGDIVLTGTPEGVGPIKSGDHISMSLFSGGLEEKNLLCQARWDFK